MHEVQSTFPVGTLIRGRYTVVELLNQDASGATYLVTDKRNQLNRFVLKEVIQTVRKEKDGFPFNAARLKRLKHPALPHIHQVFYSDKHNRLYILMDYIEGCNLEEMQQQLPEKRASLPQAITLISPIINAVSYLHQQQPPLIHGNINPSNIIMPETGSIPVLVDLGGIKEYVSDSTTNIPHQSTLNYLAPEQLSSRTGTRSDIYALGALLYTLLTGTAPVAAFDRLAALDLKVPDPLLPVNQIVPSVPATVARAIYRAMSINSRDRFSTVEQFWEALWQVITPANSIETWVSEQAITFPAKEQSEEEVDVDPTEQPIHEQINMAPLAEQRESEAQSLLPQTIEPVEPTPEMDSPMFNTNPTLHIETPPVFATSDSLFMPAFPEDWKPPVRVPSQEQSPAHRFKKPRLLALLLVGLALLVSISLGSGIRLYSAGLHHLPAVSPTAAGQFRATPHPSASTTSKSTATPGPVSISYPKLAGQYDGVIYSLPDNITTKLSLTGIQQQQGTISGSFSGLLRNGRFQGTIDTTRHVYFVTTADGGQVPITFEGAMQSGGNVAGSYCIQNQAKQCSSYGLWSVSATPSK